MCGIAGIALRDPQEPADAETLRAMNRVLWHRGPDEEGYYRRPGIGLAMRRLAVIDLHQGHQPLLNEDGQTAAVFNGEIYNYAELRRRLEARGHQFRSHTDGEVIVHLYEDHGPEFVSHLHGMFAIALWDGAREQLVLARDRLGVKPLYIAIDSRQIAFASEIKSLLQVPGVRREVNWEGIDALLTWGHIPAPATCFQGIEQLPQASYLVYRHGNSTTRRYWDVQPAPDSQTYSAAAAQEELQGLLEQAVRRRLASDVPLGALLSGGIDSSMVVATLYQLGHRPIRTFSIGFDDPSFNELPAARQVADWLGTEHHELVVRPDLESDLPLLIRHHDAPFYDSSAVPMYYVSRLAREFVTVVLSGDGGDELFAGYNMYRAHRMAEFYGRLPLWLRQRVLRPLLERVPERSGPVNLGRVLREFAAAGDLDPLARFARWNAKIKRETRQQLYAAPGLAAHLEQSDRERLSRWYDRHPAATPLARLLYTAMNTDLVDDMLVKVDRMSMACSLEVRSPLLDHQLFEFAATLPDEAKLRGLTTKCLLRQLASRRLPPAILKRPKRGFSIPLDRWIRGPLARMVHDVLLDRRATGRGLFRRDFIERMLRLHQSGARSYARELWALLTIELWLQMYLDRQPVFPTPQTESRPPADHVAPVMPLVSSSPRVV